MNIPAAKVYFPEKDVDELFSRYREILASGRFTLGKNGEELEKYWMDYKNVKNAIAVNSGTAAVELALRTNNVENSEIIVPTNTFIATASAVVHSKAKPVLADINESFCLDPKDLNEKINKNTKAVIYVHIGGYISKNILEIKKICEDNKVLLIEDAAQAHGSSLNGKYAGTYGIVSGFSLYPTKVITSGEGGMILTDDDKIAEKARIFRDQGKASFFSTDFIEFGHNFRLSEFHAALGVLHFKHLKEFIDERNEIAKKYDKKLKNISGLESFRIEDGSLNNFYKYIVLLDEDIDRARIKKELKEKYNVNLSGEVYEKPLHKQLAFRDFKFKENEFKNADDLCAKHICLPVYNTMKDEEIDYVVESLKKVI